MKIEGKYQLDDKRENVWRALNDPDVLRQCIPGCESLNKTGDTTFDADVVAKIGPVKARFKTVVALENINPPESYTLSGNGKGGSAGFGKGKADVKLKPKDDGTELTYTADFKVGGKLAQVGSRLVAGATRKIADDFFVTLAGLLESQPEAAVVPSREARGIGAWIIVLLAAAALAAWWFWFGSR